MRLALMLTLAMCSFASGGASGDPTSKWPHVGAYFAAQQRAFAAYEKRDAPAFVANAKAMLEANPGHPPARYALAAASALVGDPEAALAELDALAAMGLVQQPRREPAFAALLDDPRFTAIEARFAGNAKPRGEVRVVLDAHGLPGDFIPEAFARDEDGKRTLFASVRQRRIAAVGDDGSVSDFVPTARDGLMSALGIHVAGDEVLVASSGMAEMRPGDAALHDSAGIFAFARDDGSLRGKWMLPTPSSGRGHAIGDLLVLPGGRILAGDSGGGALFVLDRRLGHWFRLYGGLGLGGDADWFGSPQGMAQLADDRVVFADYTTGLWIVDRIRIDLHPQENARPARASSQLARLESDELAALYGIDGLYAYGDDLIATQNGTNPQRVLRLRLNAERNRIVRVEVLASAHPHWDEITLGEVVGDEFRFVANSHWSKFDANGELPAADTLSAPVIMAVDLR